MPRRSTMHSRKNRILSSALYCSIVIFLNLAINIVCVSFIYATNNQRLVYLKDVFSSHRTGFGIFICGFVILVAILSFCLLFKNPHRFTNSINTAYFLIAIAIILQAEKNNNIFVVDAIYDIDVSISFLILILCKLVDYENMKILYYVVVVGGFYLYFTIINCISKLISEKFAANGRLTTFGHNPFNKCE